MSDTKKNFLNEDIDQQVEVLDLDFELEDVDTDDMEPIFHDSDEETQEASIAQQKEELRQNLRKEIRSWVLTLIITFVCIYALKNYVIINALVPTGSMENTIMPEDQLFGNRLAYLFSEPARGDIIFFYFPDDPKHEEKFVKRIIGLPGEKVTITGGKVYINDSTEPLDEPYLKEEWVYNVGPYEFEVPEGCYFVMGDNRNTSRDSRVWKNPYVPKEDIIGQAGFIYYPLDRIGVVK